MALALIDGWVGGYYIYNPLIFCFTFFLKSLGAFKVPRLYPFGGLPCLQDHCTLTGPTPSGSDPVGEGAFVPPLPSARGQSCPLHHKRSRHSAGFHNRRRLYE